MLRPLLLVSALISLIACSAPSESVPLANDGGGDARDSEVTDPGTTLRKVFEARAVRKIEPAGNQALLFREAIGGHLIDERVPRSLTWVDGSAAVTAEAASLDDEIFIDAVSHPSGESTLFVRKGDRCALRRYDGKGVVIAETTLADLDLESDPTESNPDPDGPPWNLGGCQPNGVFETGRLAADGEDLYLVNRGGSHGMVLFRYRFESGGYRSLFRLPIAPRHRAYLPTGIGASHRLLRMRNWSWIPRVVVDDAHRARVLLTFGGGLPSDIYDSLATFPAGANALGVILTVSSDGKLEASRIVPRELGGEGTIAELETMRWARGSLLLAGRTAQRPPPADGLGWDGLVTRFIDGESSPAFRARIHTDRGEVVSDVHPLGETSWLAVGRAGYWQNPTGASISEEASAAAWVLRVDGSIARAVSLANGPRHNAALTIAQIPSSGALFLGGLQNGPGSHSADRDPTLRRSDGWFSIWSTLRE